MSKKFPHLLCPLKIGKSVVLKNRMLSPNASPHFLQGPETFPAEGFIAYAANLAGNGAAVVTLAEWCNPFQRKDMLPDAKRMQSFDITDPSVHNYFCQLADEVHFHGSKLILNCDIEFPEGYSLNGAPAGMFFAKPIPATEPIPIDMMERAYEATVEKLNTYRGWGWDGVNMRVDRILQKDENERADDYGGNLENRTRFLRNGFEYIRKAMGPDFIIEIALPGEQPFGYTGEIPDGSGYTVDDCVEFARLTEGVVDILQIREKDQCRSHPTGYSMKKREHDTIGYCRAIKAAGVKTYLEAIGGFQMPSEMDALIAEGVVDMFGMARAFLCDPDYLDKMEEGREEDITPCLKCNRCHGAMQPPWLVVCSVNPLLGIEHKLGRMVKEKPFIKKKVAVIGGGPAGMRAAIMAAEKGHDVTLYEKTGCLGGQILHADYASFKWPIHEFKLWLINQLDKQGVSIVLNCAPAPDALKSDCFDTVIAAVGASPNMPDIKGLPGNFMSCVDVFGRESELGRHVAIIGGSEVGMETAMYLAENGHRVTVLTRQDKPAPDAPGIHYVTMAFVKTEGDRAHLASAWERYENIDIITGATTSEIVESSVTYLDKSGGKHVLKCDSVVLSGGSTPRADEALRYSNSADRFLLVGDCNSMGNLQRCMRDVYAKVLTI